MSTSGKICQTSPKDLETLRGQIGFLGRIHDYGLERGLGWDVITV
jgi:hypothetical protein